MRESIRSGDHHSRCSKEADYDAVHGVLLYAEWRDLESIQAQYIEGGIAAWKEAEGKIIEKPSR